LGHSGTPKYEYDIKTVVSACKKYNKAIEINNHSFEVRKGSDVNCIKIAEECMTQGVNIVVSTDAHAIWQLKNAKAALEKLEDIGFPEKLILNTSKDRLYTWLASRGRETLAFGTMKPVGLTDPHTGTRPHAVVQLRQENAEGTVYGLVGFQTQMRQSEQDRIFRMIPGLENAEFVRYGAVHRNTYIDSPNILTPALSTKLDMGLFFAGQMVGVEGYMESAASGIVAGINAARVAMGEQPVTLPAETVVGALLNYIAHCPAEDFQPMNSNFGILPPILEKHPKRLRKELKAARAADAMDRFVAEL
jgi:tRNA:m(5)U-54 methyltransferase